MKLETAELLIDTARTYGLAIEPYEGTYSGRGMYGEGTHAVLFDDHATLLECVALSVRNVMEYATDLDEIGEVRKKVNMHAAELGRLRFDSLGLQLIAY